MIFLLVGLYLTAALVLPVVFNIAARRGDPDLPEGGTR